MQVNSVCTSVISLTPELAAQLLKSNVSNRPLRKDYVAMLAEAMKRGEWLLNGDAVRVAKSGRLVDGQHRCWAVVQSGVTIQVLLVTGLEEDVFATIDRGMGRSVGDTLSISGEINANKVAAVLRLLYVYSRTKNPFSTGRANQPTTKQLVELLDENKAVRESVRCAISLKWLRKIIPLSHIGFCHFLFTKNDSVASKNFFEALEYGVGLHEGSPVLLLRNRLIDSHSSKDSLVAEYRMALIFKAYKYSRDGVSLKTLRVRTEGEAVEGGIFLL